MQQMDDSRLKYKLISFIMDKMLLLEIIQIV